uniref:Uncharacterized protein n=1 Tax=Panagrellus redivivus TaxID=6233 RepID=A0A7E4VXR3_PANRE
MSLNVTQTLRLIIEVASATVNPIPKRVTPASGSRASITRLLRSRTAESQCSAPVFDRDTMRLLLICFGAFVAICIVNGEPVEVPGVDPEELASMAKKVLPSQRALEMVGVTFLDALIKAGQIEMAKGAFKTQLNVMKKVQPDQYKKLKDIPLEQFAADAVFEQAKNAKNGPKTGNGLIDMLNENGIPIASSLKGIQQAIKTQREIEDSDPSEQVAKAVLEKFQKQILPGLVANMIAGRNPFQLPQRPEFAQLQKQQTRMLKDQQEQAMKAMQQNEMKSLGKVQSNQFDMGKLIGQAIQPQRPPPQAESDSTESSYEDEDEENTETEDQTEAREAPAEPESGPEPEIEYEDESNEIIAPARRPSRLPQMHRYKRQTRLVGEGEEEDMEESFSEADRTEVKIGRKAAMLLGIYEGFPDLVDEDEEVPKRRHPGSIPIELAERVLKSERLRSVFLKNDEMAYKLTDPERFLVPMKPLVDPEPQPGYVTPRPIPSKPRKMLPLLIGKDSEFAPPSFEPRKQSESDEYESETDSSSTESDSSEKLPKPLTPFQRRSPIATQKHPFDNADNMMQHGGSRSLKNLMNNPGLAPLFQDDDLIKKLRRPSVLTADQRMGAGTPESTQVIRPRAHGVTTLDGETMPPTAQDMKVKQIIEEREIPPLFFIPKGRHTRLRWTGATEKEIPGLGTRIVMPSLDPTMPAVNSVISTQGKSRDEYDSTFKIPNYWAPGDVFGIDAKMVQERLVGGDAGVDFPAMQAGMNFG